MRIALDTNLLAYAEGLNGEPRRTEARTVLQRLDDEDLLIPIQALGELVAVLTRKARRDRAQVRAVVQSWAEGYPLLPTTASVFSDAMDVAAVHRLQIWDAIILAAAAEAHSEVLLTEDMQDGSTWRGVTVRGPFGGNPLRP